MTQKRSRLEIYLDVLRAIKKGVNKPTRIMYKTNLSWKPLQEILESMTSQEIIKDRGEQKEEIRDHRKRLKRAEILRGNDGTNKY